MTINVQAYYFVSKDVITREIEGELVIVPMISGIGNLDSQMYSLNKTGAAIWEKLDGKLRLDEIIHGLAKEFNTSYEQIKNDVLSLMEDFDKMGLLLEK